MRVAILAVALSAFSLGANAGPPHDLWGYFPGQTVEQAQGVDANRSPQDCTFKGVWKCISWQQEYLGQDAEIAVQFDDEKKVKQIVFNILNYKQKQFYDCAQTIAAVVGEASKSYGAFSEETPGKSYVWRDGGLKYELTVFCLPSARGPMVGGVVGSFRLEN